MGLSQRPGEGQGCWLVLLGPIYHAAGDVNLSGLIQRRGYEARAAKRPSLVTRAWPTSTNVSSNSPISG